MEAREWTATDTARVLRAPTSASHKYSRGVVSLRTGSPRYPGAAVLSVEGAARAGAGMVRWIGDPEVARLVLHRRPETVTSGGRTDAWAIGSGTDARERTDAERAELAEILTAEVPKVIDAGALDLAAGARGPFVVTPHDRELAEVRIPLGLGVDDLDGDPLADRLKRSFEERLLVVRETAVALGGAVLLKGATTLIASPTGWWTAVRAGTPWLSTAGTGDVLAGAVGAIAAACAASESLDVEGLARAAAAGAWLHGHAGRLAAGAIAGPGHPITALDVAEHLPAAWAAAARS